MPARNFIPGVPMAGHITTAGYWHPGPANNCSKCHPRRPEQPTRGKEDA